MSLEIKKFLTNKIPLTSLADAKLNKLKSLADVAGVAALPDIHAKPDNPYPTGTVVLTNNTIYPTLIGQDIGCAIGVWHSSLKASALTTEIVQRIFKQLTQGVSDNKPKKSYVSREDLRKILSQGALWALERNLISEEEVVRIEHGGQFLSDEEQRKAASSIPRDAFKGGLRKARSLGGGNHFLELQKVVEILDKEAASALGIQEDDLLLWIHTGSSSFGKRLENFYTQRWDTSDYRRRLRQQWRRFLYHFELNAMNRLAHRMRLIQGSASHEGLDAQSPEGKRYLTAHRAAMNYALVNRIFLSHMVKKAVSEDFPDARFQLLIDVAHESIQQEKLKNGKFWVHRNGASRAVPPQCWEDPWQKGLGQLLPLPGSLGSSSFLAMSQSGVEHSFWAVNHGAGRVLEKPQARDAVSREELARFEKQKDQKIFYAGGGDDLVEQVPAAFKDITEVARALEVHNLAKLILRCEPIASLKS